MKGAQLITAFVLLASATQAQEAGPLSAIDWLSNSVDPNIIVSPLGSEFGTGVAPLDGAESPMVTVTPLDSGSPDLVGLLPPSMTGLPNTIWSASTESILVSLVTAERTESVPAIQDFLTVLLLAEAKPPFDAGREGNLFLARVDKLLEVGALQQAQALLEAADPQEPALFRRWFDISLLTGTEDNACATMRDAPDLAPTHAVRIFCVARGGDWDTAALILNTGIALGDIQPDDERLLVRFLETEFDDHAAPVPTPDRITPLKFRLLEAIGEPVPTATLPRAFAHADLRDVASWRSQLEAAERLARYGAVDDNVLRALYTAQRPAASGGIWDRAEAFQRFDTAIRARDPVAVAAALPAAWSAMQHARTEVPFARLYAPDLAALPLTGDAAALAFHVLLLSADYEAAALSFAATTDEDEFLSAVARGNVSSVTAKTPAQQTVFAAFSGETLVPESIADLINSQKLGEALLRTIATFGEGMTGDPVAISEALVTLRTVGLEDVARRAALQYLLLDRPS
jgi:hypothetical protein